MTEEHDPTDPSIRGSSGGAQRPNPLPRWRAWSRYRGFPTWEHFRTAHSPNQQFLVAAVQRNDWVMYVSAPNGRPPLPELTRLYAWAYSWRGLASVDIDGAVNRPRVWRRPQCTVDVSARGARVVVVYVPDDEPNKRRAVRA